MSVDASQQYRASLSSRSSSSRRRTVRWAWYVPISIMDVRSHSSRLRSSREMRSRAGTACN